MHVKNATAKIAPGGRVDAVAPDGPGISTLAEVSISNAAQRSHNVSDIQQCILDIG